jgi:hypothetical protein
MTDLPDTGPLGYEPLARAWICDDHGEPECQQTEHCRALPWAATNDDRLREFMDWADAQFDVIVAPFDRGEVEEMPDDAFNAYWPADWVRSLDAEEREARSFAADLNWTAEMERLRVQ